ncbi:hypothetical protein Bca101_009583 [Brassica carinata]
MGVDHKCSLYVINLSSFPWYPDCRRRESGETAYKARLLLSTCLLVLGGLLRSRKRLRTSRVRVTSKVVELINSSPVEARPTVSSISETGLFDGNSPSANDYLSEVCREWEGTALKANKDARVALIRKRWWGFSHDDTLFPNVCWRTSGFRTTLVKLNTSGFRTMRPSLNHSIKELSMGLRQTRLGFADGYQFLTLHSKLCSEKVPLWFLKDRRSYL